MEQKGQPRSQGLGASKIRDPGNEVAEVGGSSVFEPLVWGGSFSFELPKGVDHPVLYGRNWHTFDTICDRGNSFQFQRTKTFRAVADKVH